ncbi:uncharacterized protein BDR25DRAFT_316521 [Lindgomyces ingoldianus]|uniref:Uncharacterized protein n=1 Tax=Lindgomyces ingoldianus TaxID=673940 RepID=A0ACB6QMT8_9PLEO|nr:uncharacterized protein BDR25DRAFT_316521 [Lindgomyces ingoldianus]KAF2467903.1 hypothetical protein BDR25DRAFT_316521 [Lindgomyces ingoldianus]
MCFIWRRMSQVVLIAGAFYISPTAGMLWGQCLKDVQDRSLNDEQFIFDRALFHNGSTPENPILTLRGCKSLCGGPGLHIYPDWGSMHQFMGAAGTPVREGNGLWDTIHILANPIHWFIEMLRMIEHARRFRRLASDSFIPGLEDGYRQGQGRLKFLTRLKNYESQCVQLYTWKNVKEDDYERKIRIKGTYLQALKTASGISVAQTEYLHREILQPLLKTRKQNTWEIEHEIAEDIATSRSGRLLLAVIAITLYIWQVVSSFVQVIGGSWTTVPGGRIGLAMFWQWMVAAVLISNFVGSFPTEDYCKRIVKKVYGRAGVDFDEEIKRITSFPPNHGERRFSRRWRRRVMLVLVTLAILPVLSSIVGSLAVLWYLPPKGPNCRFFLLVSISFVYIVNAVLTSLLLLGQWTTRIKDLLIALTSTILIILSACGLFNTCACWSGVYHLGPEKATVYLNSEEVFAPLLRKVYPAIFVTCFVFQFISFEFMRWFGCEGMSILRWSKRTKKRKTESPESRGLLDPCALRGQEMELMIYRAGYGEPTLRNDSATGSVQITPPRRGRTY